MAAQSKEKKALLLYLLNKRQQRKKRRRCWIHNIVNLRPQEGEFATLLGKLREDEVKFFNYFRMSAESFDELLSCVLGKLTHNSMQMRDAVPAIEKLALTLR